MFQSPLIGSYIVNAKLHALDVEEGRFQSPLIGSYIVNPKDIEGIHKEYILCFNPL